MLFPSNMNDFIFFAVSNPYVTKLNTILSDVKGWLLALDATVTVAMIAFNAIKYQQGNTGDKDQALDNIKKSIYVGAGVFALIWIAEYVIGVFAK